MNLCVIVVSPKMQQNIFASRLQEKALLNKTTSYFRNRELFLQNFILRRISLLIIISRVLSKNKEFHCIIQIIGDYSKIVLSAA